MLAGTQHNGLFYFDNSTTNGRQVPLITKNNTSVNYYVTAVKYDAAKNITYGIILYPLSLIIFNTIEVFLIYRRQLKERFR